MYDNYLEHHGVKGQRWGFRRYQYKDGSLTPQGRAKMLKDAQKYERKANTSVAENYFAKSRKARLTQKAKNLRGEVRRNDLAKARKKQEAIKTFNSDVKKNSKDMDYDELVKAIDRMEKEKRYNELYNQLNPKPVKKGNEFAQRFLKEAVTPALLNASKKMIDKGLSRALGEETNTLGNTLDTLKKKKEIQDTKTYLKIDPKLREEFALKDLQAKIKQKEDTIFGKNKDKGKTKEPDVSTMDDDELDYFEELIKKRREEM